MAIPNDVLRYYNPHIISPFPNPAHEHKRDALTANKKVIKALRPHFTSINMLGIDEGEKGFYDVFRNCGLVLDEIMEDDTCDALVVDFFASFELMKEEGVTVGWKFVVQGIPFEFRKEDIMYHLRFTCSTDMPTYSEAQRRAFWRTISKDPSQRTRNIPQEIKCVKWRYIHQVVAVNINTRLSKGKIVTNKDLDFMQLLYNEEPIDMFTVYTARFEEMSNPNSANKALGCTSIITALAKAACGFIFLPEDTSFKRLNVPRLIQRGLLDPKWERSYYSQAMITEEDEDDIFG